MLTRATAIPHAVPPALQREVPRARGPPWRASACGSLAIAIGTVHRLGKVRSPKPLGRRCVAASTATADTDVKLQLHGGATMPALGLGTWGGSDDPGTVGKAVREALEAGYRSVDCAECYGNEREIGKELREFLDQGTVPRSELFITSKVWNTNHKPEHVLEACENTLEALQLDYLDLYLVHWPLAWDYVGKAPFDNALALDEEGRTKMAPVGLHETWAAMESLVDQGKVKSIGVSNFSSLVLGDLLAYARIKPAVNQVEAHPYLQQRNLLEFCRRNDVVLAAYAPLGRPGQNTDCNASAPLLLEDPVVCKIAAERSVLPATVVLAWALARGTVALPKSSSPERLRQNLAAYRLALTAEELDALNALDRNCHFCDYKWNHGCGLYD